MKTAMRDRTYLRDDRYSFLGYENQPYATYAAPEKNLLLATSPITRHVTNRFVGHVPPSVEFKIGGIKLPAAGDFVLRTPVVMNVI